MTRLFGQPLRRIAVRLGMLGAGAVLLALALAYSGIYSVAASKGHPAWLDWYLALGMRRSVTMHSLGIDAPPLDSPERIRLGAGHFHLGCGNCHGAPGIPGNPIYASMLPTPPSLERFAETWDDAELYWIVRHGIQYAGMPAWSGEGRDDEIWSVVAFLRTLPELDAEGYFELAAGNIVRPPYSAEALTRLGGTMLPLSACSRCHDTATAPPTSALVPRLGGQSRGYLVEALTQYRDGARESGIMEPVSSQLSRAEIEALADYYGGLASPQPDHDPAPGDAERGRVLAESGDPATGLPPCDACHAPGVLPAYPRLAGQSAAYLTAQLELWRDGQRAGTPLAEIMATIGQRLDDRQIADVSAHYAGLAPFNAEREPSSPAGEAPR